MKSAFYFVIIGLLFAVFACKKGDQSYSFSRPTNDQNFKTIQGGELYAYTANDTAVNRADYYMIVEGYVVNYGSTIIEYGHCWNTGTSSEPTINDHRTIFNESKKSQIPEVGDSISFQSVLDSLDDDTEYNVRSYVITEDERMVEGKKTVVRKEWYNPITKPISTKPAIDEWFEQCLTCPDGGVKPTPEARFDAIVFNLGDTVFFGTGQQGLGGGMTKDIIMYTPEGGWDPDFVPSIPKFSNNTLNAEMIDGIGFAIVYQRKNDPPGTLTRSIFVGLGDHGGSDDYTEKANTLMEYDLEKGIWRETSAHFTGRSGAVCFVIDGLAYIGTGSGANPTRDWYVFDPVAETDGDETTPGWRGLAGTNPPGTNEEENRTGAIAFSMNGIGYFGLGTDGNEKFYDDFWAFKPSSDPTEPQNGEWIAKASFPGGGRANAVAFAIGDLGYVGSGDNLVPTGSDKVTFMEYPGRYSGQVFNDFWRYNPYTDTWLKVRDYTTTSDDAQPNLNRSGFFRPITRAVGFSAENIGYVGYGLVPAEYETYIGKEIDAPEQTSTINAQKDFWRYQPFDDSAK